MQQARILSCLTALSVAVVTAIAMACSSPTHQFAPSPTQSAANNPQAVKRGAGIGVLVVELQRIRISHGALNKRTVEILPRSGVHPLLASPTPTPLADVIIDRGTPRNVTYSSAGANLDPSCGGLQWTFTDTIPASATAYNPTSQMTGLTDNFTVTISTTNSTPIGSGYSFQAAGHCTNPNATGIKPLPIGPNSAAVVTEVLYDDVNNSDLFNEPQPIQRIIGQYNKLELRPQPAGNLAYQQWLLPGATVKSYTLTQATGAAGPLTADDLSNQVISFAWVQPISAGLDQVQFSADWPGNISGGDIGFILYDTYSVQGPSNILLNSVTTSVQVTPQSPPIWFLGFGNYLGGGAPGITYAFTAMPPQNGSGQYASTQLVKSIKAGTLRNGQPISGGTNGQSCLDNNVFDFGPSPTTSGGITGLDSPGSTINADTVAQLTKSETYQTFFMYRPDGNALNIWVALGRLDWQWQGTATQALVSGTYTGAFALSGASCRQTRAA